MDGAQERYACTLDAEGARRRLPQVHGLTDRLRRRERVGNRLVLGFEDDGDTVGRVEEFVRDESRCCSFFEFDVREEGGEIVLELSAPPGAGRMLEAAMESFDPGLSDDERIENYRRHAT